MVRRATLDAGACSTSAILRRLSCLPAILFGAALLSRRRVLRPQALRQSQFPGCAGHVFLLLVQIPLDAAEANMTPMKQFAVLVTAIMMMSISGQSHALEGAGPVAVAASQNAKQQCLNTCRVRYRDCLSLKQIPSVQCRGVYQDCSRIACNNLRGS